MAGSRIVAIPYTDMKTALTVDTANSNASDLFVQPLWRGGTLPIGTRRRDAARVTLAFDISGIFDYIAVVLHGNMTGR